ncbi:hypothetical protein HRI_001227900 [Hibiscus trionum]|uniref:Uncharacterized protein n=1 Tax=Hibiscus trionum TaxID=183268 RepID=A0A9W7HDS1_HIBTR|nr:hypothetical protein HRI_001227900 [Hibiscus trionum]
MGSSLSPFPSETKFLQEHILRTASAALFAGLGHLDPNREASKKALEHKKEISKCLPIHTRIGSHQAVYFMDPQVERSCLLKPLQRSLELFLSM